MTPETLLANATDPVTSKFDYIIVGSGAGGGPLACRLARAKKRVLLVEAGRDPKKSLQDAAERAYADAHRSWEVGGRKGAEPRRKDPREVTEVLEAPLFHAASTEEKEMAWEYSVRHYSDDARQQQDQKYTRIDKRAEPGREIERDTDGTGGVFYPRSSGIGGCTSHHAMIVIRPNDSDWERIAQLTNDDTWRAKHMQHYFAKFEHCLYIEEYRGFLANLFGWLTRLWFAILKYINPRLFLDQGGHGSKGWQPTSFISPKLIKRIVDTDRQFTSVLIKSAFRVIENNDRLTATLKKYLVMLGFVRSFDPNDTTNRAKSKDGGVFLIPTGIGGDQVRDERGESTRGRRTGLREFILKTQEEFPEYLVIASGVHVTEVLFDESGGAPKAIGIKGRKGDHLYKASPLSSANPGTSTPFQYFVRSHGGKNCRGTSDISGEVILCGGAFNTPQLLMLSGIGDETELKAKKIRVRAHLPGVGKNLQDRYEVGVISEFRDELPALDTVSFIPGDPKDKVRMEWIKDRDGLYATNGGTIAILQRSQAADADEPDLFTFGAPAAFRGYFWGWSKQLFKPELDASNNQRNLWTWVILKAYTRNNGGRVSLRSTDPFETPSICFHSFDEGRIRNAAGKEVPVPGWEKDVEALVEAVETMRGINAVSGSPFVRELQPAGYLEQKNAQRVANKQPEWTLRDWIKNEAWGHHACGTCRIGSDKWVKDPANLKDTGAVLDSHFRVHGVQNLRVVDASIFPYIPGYFILAPIFMVSEKAADTLLHEVCEESYPDEVREVEEAAIVIRRQRAFVTADNQEPEEVAVDTVAVQAAEARPTKKGAKAEAKKSDEVTHVAEQRHDEGECPPKNVVGLALSGGGVRSATFALGVLQALAEKNKLRHVDYLSTVSGGGFAGSFFGRLFTRPRVTKAGDPCGRAQDIVRDIGSSPLRWLRAQANYLFSQGNDDWVMVISVFFRNLFTVHLIVAALLYVFFATLVGVSYLSFIREALPVPPQLPEKLPLILSSWWWVPIGLLVFVILPMKFGYWLAPKNGSYRSHAPYALGAWIVLVGASSVALMLPQSSGWAIVSLVILGLAWLFQEFARKGLPETQIQSRMAEGPLVRNRLTRGLGEVLIIFLALLVWVAIDSAAKTVAAPERLSQMIAALIALAPALHLLRKWALKALPKGGNLSGFSLMKIAAVVIALALTFILDVIAHTVFAHTEFLWAWVSVLVALLFSAALGRAFDFLNLSSLHASYSARLTRTFLGASNDARTEGDVNAAADVQIAHAADDIAYHKYRPEEHGGPLHLIGMCVNETVQHASQREIRDNKGVLMTVGMFGVSVGRKYFARWSKDIDVPKWLKFRRWLEGTDNGETGPPSLDAIRFSADPNTFHPLARRDEKPAVVQSLSLGDWMAVSGAAFSTGLGRRTSLLEALFMGLVNLRLGFWWDSGILSTERPGRFPANVWRRLKEIPGKLFRMQSILLSEWKGRFTGPARELWNLTDGGHVDNTGLYELARRRVPFIIFSDATHDPKYNYEDLAIFVRNARVDFGAQVEWVDPKFAKLPSFVADWVNLDEIGTLTDIQGNKSTGGTGKVHGALAKITYPKPPNVPSTTPPDESWLLLVKSSLIGDETLDVTEYAASNPAFPQDPTTDQIYDDEQWESYRSLGFKAASCVLK